MERTAQLENVVDAWGERREALHQALAARSLTDDSHVEQLEQLVAELERAGDDLIAELEGSRGGDDDDGDNEVGLAVASVMTNTTANAAYNLGVATLETAQSLLAAGDGDEPTFGITEDGSTSTTAMFKEAILAPDTIGSTDAFGLTTQETDDDEPHATIKKLSDTVGTELVAIGAGGILTSASADFFDAIQQVVSGTAAATIGTIVQQLKSFGQRIKKLGLSLFQKAMDYVVKLLPQAAGESLTKWLENAKEDPAGTFGSYAGDLAARLLGARECEAAWQAARDAGTDLTAATAMLGRTIAPHLQQLAWVERVRKVFDIARNIIAAVTAGSPLGKIALGIVVVVGLLFVGSRLWDGINDIQALVA